MDPLIPILSLVVAVGAVLLGPLVSWAIARRQLEAAQSIANRQLVSPMRQAWINELRSKLAELLSSALHYFVAGPQDRTDARYRRLAQLEQEVVLMVNPGEEEYKTLLSTIRRMVGSLEEGTQLDDQFIELHKQVTELAQRILKAEWNRVRKGT
ncbi:MAG TPA: hypothetical protein VGB99_09360 [Acidobacteriota bacterium]